MSETDPQPQHAAHRGRLHGHRGRVALIAGLVVAVVAAGVGVAMAMSGSDDETSTAGRPTQTTERPATTERPTTTAAPTTTTTAPPETTTTLPPETTTTLPPTAEADGKLELGEGGDAVAALQGRLVELGYWLGEADGNYGQLTRQAVMAFQKVEGLGRDGVAGPVTQERLAVAGRPAPRGGGGLEIDLERQVIFVVDGGQVAWVLNTSTGNGEAYTTLDRGHGPGGHAPRRVHGPARGRRRARGPARHPVPAQVLQRRHRDPRVGQHPGPAGLPRVRAGHQLGHGHAVGQRGGRHGHPGVRLLRS